MSWYVAEEDLLPLLVVSNSHNQKKRTKDVFTHEGNFWLGHATLR